MGSGFTGEIIQAHAEGGKEGEYLSARVDFVLLPDYALALLLEDLRELRRNVWDREKVLVAVDHFAPPSTVERANVVKRVLSFVKEEGISHCSLYGGICHQLLVEGPWVGPGMVVLGADSHTTTAGALGCLATGLGSTDILYTLITGRTWLRSPEAFRVNLKGKLPAYVMGKDIALELLRRGGESGFLYQALEFYDLEGINSISYSIMSMIPLLWGLRNEKFSKKRQKKIIKRKGISSIVLLFINNIIIPKTNNDCIII